MMDNQAYFQISELEQAGQLEAGHQLLLQLAEQQHPLALLDLSVRYDSCDSFAYPVYRVEPNPAKSEALAIQAQARLLELAQVGDGEAMYMLASTYFGHWHPIHQRCNQQAEQWLLRAFDAQCYFAANDLATFYLGRDRNKAKFYYQQAEQHGCRVIYHAELEG